MKKLLSILVLAACGAPPDGEWVRIVPTHTHDNPTFFGFSDAADEARYNATPRESVEKWKSAQYYGMGDSDNDGCYRIGGVVANCNFPVSKQFRIVTDWSACSDYTDVSLLDIEQVRLGFEEGIRQMIETQLAGTGVSIVTSGGQLLRVQCLSQSDAAAHPGWLGFGGLEGITHTQISNLPSAPNGQDEAAARQISQSFTFVSPRRAREVCPVASGSNIRKLARHSGAHEFLHAAGFDHATSGLMYPTYMPPGGCTPSTSYAVIPPGVWQALKDYSGSAGSATIVNDGVDAPFDD